MKILVRYLTELEISAIGTSAKGCSGQFYITQMFVFPGTLDSLLDLQ